MKKLLSFAAGLLVLAGVTFADTKYNGDFQIHVGTGVDFTDGFKLNVVKLEYDSVVFSWDFSTCHVWGNNEFLQCGFMLTNNTSFGGVFKMSENNTVVPQDKNFLALSCNTFFGPCFAITLGNAVRFNVTPGINFVYCNFGSKYDRDTGNVDFYYGSGIGFGLDLQAKFCPKSVVSPVVGYRYTVCFGDTAYVATGNWGSSSGPFVSIDADRNIAHFNTLYAGISWNW